MMVEHTTVSICSVSIRPLYLVSWHTQWYQLLLTFCIVITSGFMKLISTRSVSILTLHHFKTISNTTQGWILGPAFTAKYLIASYEVAADVSCSTLSQLRSFLEWAVKLIEEDGWIFLSISISVVVWILESESISMIFRNVSTFVQTLATFCRLCLQCALLMLLQLFVFKQFWM